MKAKKSEANGSNSEIAPTPRAQFLAANPAAAKLQREQVNEIVSGIAELRSICKEFGICSVKVAERGRQI